MGCVAIAFVWNKRQHCAVTMCCFSRSIAMAIIQSPKWESALRNTTFTPSKDQTTPLRKLIRKMPKVTEEVFKLCTVSESSTVADDNEENNVYFNYEFLEDFRDPPRRTLRYQLCSVYNTKQHCTTLPRKSPYQRKI